MKDLKKAILENQDIRENIKEIVLGNLEMGSVGSLDFDADHIADDLMPYVMKTILDEREKTLGEVYRKLDLLTKKHNNIIYSQVGIELSKLLKETNEKE